MRLIWVRMPRAICSALKMRWTEHRTGWAAEVGKPFPQEQELAEKTARLVELDLILNLDSKGRNQPEQAIAKTNRPSVLDKLKTPPVHSTPDKPHKKEMEVR